MTKFPSEKFNQQFDQALIDLAKTISQLERNSCAELVQQMADAEEDAVRKDLLNDCATAIRRMPYANYR